MRFTSGEILLEGDYEMAFSASSSLLSLNIQCGVHVVGFMF
jgi:hypothetical protein